jgi:hypothetical protein
MRGSNVPLASIGQQRIAFEDYQKAIPRILRFSIDHEGQTLGRGSQRLAACVHCSPPQPSTAAAVGGRLLWREALERFGEA